MESARRAAEFAGFGRYSLGVPDVAFKAFPPGCCRLAARFGVVAKRAELLVRWAGGEWRVYIPLWFPRWPPRGSWVRAECRSRRSPGAAARRTSPSGADDRRLCRLRRG